MKSICIENKIIVIGGNHHNTLGLIRSIGEVGLLVDLILEPCKKNFRNVHRSKYVNRYFQLNSLSELTKILLDNYGNEPQKSIVLCGSDTSISILDNQYEELKNKFFIFNSHKQQGGINYYMNKYNTFDIASNCGFDIAKTWHISGANSIPVDLTYPCILKGNNSTSSLKTDMYVCYSEKELLSNLRNGIDYIVQEYIEKDIELDFVGFAYNQGQNLYLPAVVRKLRDYMQRQSDYIQLDDIKNYPKRIMDAISKYVATVGFEGIFSIELMKKGDKFYFLEMNMRNDGTGYLYTKAGANYPLLWVLYCNGLILEKTLAACKVKTPFYLMQMDDVANVINGKVNPFIWLKQALTVDAYFTLNINDMLPFYMIVKIRFRQMIKKIWSKMKIFNH